MFTQLYMWMFSCIMDIAQNKEVEKILRLKVGFIAIPDERNLPLQKNAANNVNRNIPNTQRCYYFYSTETLNTIVPILYKQT